MTEQGVTNALATLATAFAEELKERSQVEITVRVTCTPSGEAAEQAESKDRPATDNRQIPTNDHGDEVSVISQPGTVVRARVRISDAPDYQEMNLMRTSDPRLPWVDGDGYGAGPGVWADKYVKVLRVICGPDGEPVEHPFVQIPYDEGSGFSPETLRDHPWKVARDKDGDFYRYNPVRDNYEMFYVDGSSDWESFNYPRTLNSYLSNPATRWATAHELSDARLDNAHN